MQKMQAMIWSRESLISLTQALTGRDRRKESKTRRQTVFNSVAELHIRDAGTDPDESVKKFEARHQTFEEGLG